MIGTGPPWTQARGSVRPVEPPGSSGRTHHRLREELAESGRRALQLEARIETLEEIVSLYAAESAWLWAELHAAPDQPDPPAPH